MSQPGFTRTSRTSTFSLQDNRPWGSPPTREGMDSWVDRYEVKPQGHSGTTRGTMDPDATWLNPTDWSRVDRRMVSHSRSTTGVNLHLNGDTWQTYSWDAGADIDLLDFPYCSRKFQTFENTKDRLINQVLLNLRQKRLSLGADAGEIRQTLGMIAGSAIPLAQGVLAAKRGNFGALPQIFGMDRKSILSGKYPANKFLEYQYGWKPLMGSIYSGVDALKNGLRKGQYPPRYSATSRASDQIEEESTREARITGFRHNVKKRYSVSGHAKLWYEVSNATLDTVDSMGLLNPLSIAWELVPFSFVVDWFAPVGNTLSALTSTSGLRFVTGYVSMKELSTVSLDIFQRPDAPADTYRLLSAGNANAEEMSFGRRVFADFPTPRFYVNPHPFSSAHIANAVALIRQMF